MLSIELSCCFLIELEHFKVRYIELFLCSCNHFAKVHISIRFQHAVCPKSQH